MMSNTYGQKYEEFDSWCIAGGYKTPWRLTKENGLSGQEWVSPKQVQTRISHQNRLKRYK